MDMTYEQKFWDKLAAKYATLPIKDVKSYEITLERTRSHLTAEDHVLELGCGTGMTAVTLAASVAEVTASDISPQMVAIGRKRATDACQDNVTFVAAEPLDQKLTARAPYDAVAGFNLFHLLRDPEAYFRHIAGLLKPDGLFISKTPCIGQNKGYLRPLIAIMRMIGKAPSYVGFFKVVDLERMITTAGFEIIETGDYPAKVPSHFVVARKR